MPKFLFTLTETFERTNAYTLNVKKKDVVEYCDLEAGDDWEDSVETYVVENWEKLKADATTDGEFDENLTDTLITSIEKDED